ncbi:MAG: cation diffusion facilitator family transporter [Candidatus Thorarchaeota archaeon]
MSNKVVNNNSAGIDRDLRNKYSRNVAIIGLVLNLVLAGIKIGISIAFGSIALLADGLDSALDLATTLLGFVAIKISDRPADHDHQFGHEKFENFFSLGIAVLLVASSGIIGFQAVNKLINKTLLDFSWYNIIIAGSSIIIKGILVWVNITVGKKIESPILIANGKNFRTDILTSAVVLISVIVGPLSINSFSLFWVDPSIAIIISIVIIFTAISITRESATVLLDQSPDQKIINGMTSIAGNVEGVEKIGAIRARNIGANIILADLDILLDPKMTIEEGHKIACNVEEAIRKEMPVKYLQIHVEPYYKKGEPCNIEEEVSE